MKRTGVHVSPKFAALADAAESAPAKRPLHPPAAAAHFEAHNAEARYSHTCTGIIGNETTAATTLLRYDIGISMCV